MEPDELDVAGFAVGVLEKGTALGPERVNAEDVLIGIASPGLRSNGYTLARHVLLERAQLGLDDPAWEGADVTVADELLRPSVIYAPAILDAMEAAPGAVHAIAHITGGGIPGNLVRALPEGVDALVGRAALPVPRIFTEIQRLGNVSDEEMSRVFNLGVGMIMIVDAEGADAVLESLEASGHDCAPVGVVVPGTRQVVLS